jgi:hypothetical protein
LNPLQHKLYLEQLKQEYGEETEIENEWECLVTPL